MDLYPFFAYAADDLGLTTPLYGGAKVKIIAQGGSVFICASLPRPTVAVEFAGTVRRDPDAFAQYAAFDDAGTILYRFRSAGGCGCSDPMKRWRPEAAIPRSDP